MSDSAALHRSPPPAKGPEDPRPPPYYVVRLGGQDHQAWDVASAIIEGKRIPFSEAHALAIAIEYIVRAGEKKPDTLVKDLVKARNALDRTIRGLADGDQ